MLLLGEKKRSLPTAASAPVKQVQNVFNFALLTPYNGGNLGDAAIQDSMIANLRSRLPNALFSGISLNCALFPERHGTSAFPLCATSRPFYGMSCPNPTADGRNRDTAPVKRNIASLPKRVFRKIAGSSRILRVVCNALLALPNELLHVVRGFKFLRTQDLLIVSGGGQLDDEWGGAWGHPFALFKWSLLARLAGIPCAFVSVGVGKIRSRVSRFLLAMALRMADYRSYRDANTRKAAAALCSISHEDPVVPDLAFSLPVEQPPAGDNNRPRSRDGKVVAISLIAFAKPGSWPLHDNGLHDRYLRQMSLLLSCLLDHDYSVILLCSSLGDDDQIIPQLAKLVEPRLQARLVRQIDAPPIATWNDFTHALLKADCLVASRLHSTLFGFLTHTPTVAISFDPKVDWLMHDLEQTQYLFQIRDFVTADIVKAVEHIGSHRGAVIDQIVAYQKRIESASARQFDELVQLAVQSSIN